MGLRVREAASPREGTKLVRDTRCETFREAGVPELVRHPSLPHYPALVCVL